MSELIRVENNNVVIAQEVIEAIVSIEDRKKQAEAEEKEMKEQFLKAMEEYGVNQIKNDYFTISYKAPYERESIDTKALTSDFPKIAEQYKKVSKCKASVAIKVVEDKR